MGRIPRMKIKDEPTVYHVMSRTALEGFPLGDIEKDQLVELIQKFSSIYFSEILGYCVMGNHWHLALRMHPESGFSDEEMIARYKGFYGEEKEVTAAQISFYRQKWGDLSEFIKDIKQTFSRFYNKRHHRTGFFWGDRFKSLIVEKGATLVNCLAYIDLNPVRAGIVKTPEEYRWCSLGYHTQTGNQNAFLSLDLGVKEFGSLDATERFRRYRKFVYETGAVERRGGAVIDLKTVQKEAKKDFRITRTMRFKHRTRYFSDSGIIGTKKYVFKVYQKFKENFGSRNDRKPNRVKGFDDIFSLKKLSE